MICRWGKTCPRRFAARQNKKPAWDFHAGFFRKRLNDRSADPGFETLHDVAIDLDQRIERSFLARHFARIFRDEQG
jgi:hypothetical protein